ncbi:MAG TPA: hypothetical protein VHM26_13990 [Chitinophagaceae bacterium]|jgi:hypothetical protein|nr:hypothetical protein [Chitinophagaceae bacterium]
MQVEDIIQQKEWAHLTDAEKELLQPLADDEQEFNLLKKMLLLAEEDAVAAPLIDPKVQQRLHESIAGKRKVVFSKKWYYAAAAILIIALTAWFLLQPSKKQAKDEDVAITPPPTIEKKIDTPSIVTNDPKLPEVKIKPQVTPTIKDSSAPIIAPPVYVQRPPIRPEIDTIKIDKPQLAVVSTIVKSDNTLMAFVTEVY